MINLYPNIGKLGTLEDPVPPAGSDWDQSTYDVTATNCFIVAGEIDGDPSNENYFAQSFKNTRSDMTGFGFVFHVDGMVTNDLVVLLGDHLGNPNDPDETWIAGGAIEPLAEGSYWITLTPSEPIVLVPGATYYIVLASNQPVNSADPQDYWCWYVSDDEPYPNGMLHSTHDGPTWENLGYLGLDTIFFTFTSTGVVGCTDYTTQTSCVAANCYWYNGSCHSTPQGGECTEHQTQAACVAANCFWYKKYLWDAESCHDAEQNMMMDYLPFIIAGVGGVIIIAALVIREPAPAAPTYHPTPSHYPQPPKYLPPA